MFKIRPAFNSHHNQVDIFFGGDFEQLFDRMADVENRT